MSPLVMTVEEAAQHLGCGRTRVFALIRDGVVRRARRIGRRTMVFRESVEAALALPDPRESPAPAHRAPLPAPAGNGRAIEEAIRRLPLSTADRPGAAR